MESRTFQLLEFPKVLEALAGFAASKPGADACLAIAPYDDLSALEARRDLLRQWMSWAGESGFSQGGFPSLAGLFAYLERPEGVLDLDALMAVSQVLDQARLAREKTAEAGKARWPLLAELAAFDWPRMIWSALRRCLNNDGLLRDESSPELSSVRAEIRLIHQKCTKKVKDFLLKEDLASCLQEEFMTLSSDRYVLPLKTNFKGKLRGIVHDYSQTGETCYVEPLFLVEINNTLQELKKEEREEERRVLIYLTGILRESGTSLRAAYDFLVQVDVLMAETRFAAELDARPLDTGEGLPLRLRGAFHPLLVFGRKRDGEDGESVVPVDLELEPGQRALVISGGNAGGKTVCLKTLGLAALMAQCGLPVPAAEGSTLPAWSGIFVLMGDEQSLEDSLSTFTAQIRRLSRAWQDIDENTLVIMDEFGAGTDPGQGAALAQAVLDHLLEKRAFIATATHFPALKAYALATEGVRAASVLFDPRTQKPLYVLAYGQVGASRALDVAREHGLGLEVLERAEKYMLMNGSGTSKVMDRLNALAVQREREISELKKERAALDVKKARLVENFERERKALLDEIKSQAQDVLREWRAGQTGRKRALKDLAEARKKLAQSASETASLAFSWESIASGDKVGYAVWGRSGVVREKDEKRKKVKLDMDGVSLWADIQDLVPEPGGSIPVSSGSVSSGGFAPVREGPSSLRLDLRGFRSEEAKAALSRFLDQALLAGHGRVEVVHGRGTGALRREVDHVLRDFPAVESFDLAPEDQGGDGMTLVDLK
ncbi:MAG: Smr/MutS family protein [Thermodesulfobacteriota bacterium]|nr:Smr/MutS family protein [Thermodesulfobacteriota bacterium]